MNNKKIVYLKYVGNKLRTLRKNKGITQVQMAADLSMRQATISKIERGLSEPGIFTLFQISEYLGVHVGYFLGEITVFLFR